MPTISLTEFYDYLSAAGMKKATIVRKIKNKDAYNPQEDYYKGFRDAVQSFHHPNETSPAKDFFKQFLAIDVHSKKVNLYKKMCDGYRKFLANAEGIRWGASKKYKWEHGELTVKLSPIWTYKVGGETLVVKPHLNKTSLARAKDKVDILLCLMREADTMAPETRIAIFDVGASRLHSDEPTDPVVSALLKSEAETFMTLYDQV
jgi:hypothetical protein